MLLGVSGRDLSGKWASLQSCAREVTAAEMGGKGMVVGDFSGLSRRKRPGIRKNLWGRKPEALGKTCAHSARWLWFIYLGKARSTFPY